MRAITKTTAGVLSRLTGSGGPASANRKIFNAAMLVAMATIVVKLVSLGKDQTVAAWFGTGDAVDCFLIAYALPAFVINVVGGSFNAALVPTYIRVREQEGDEQAQRLFSGVLLVSFGLLIVAALVLAIAFPYLLPLLAHGFDAAKLQAVRGLFWLLLPAIVINGLGTLLGAVLNAGERFLWMALTPIATPLISIAALIAFGGHFGIQALAAATTIGLGVEMLLLAMQLHHNGIRLRRPTRAIGPSVRQVFEQYLPTVAGACLMGAGLLIDQAMAAMLPAGSVATLNYGNKLVAVCLNIGATALGVAVLPYFSKMTANGEWANMRHVLKTYTRLIVGVTVPVVLVLSLVSEPLIALIYQHGAFTAANTRVVALVLRMFLLQVPFYLLGTLNVRVISALRGNQILMYATMINLPVDVAMNWIGMKFFGVAGIALSTSIVYVCSYIFVSVALRRMLHRQEAAALANG